MQCSYHILKGGEVKTFKKYLNNFTQVFRNDFSVYGEKQTI